MHAQLVRAACTLPALQAPLLPLLVSFLGAYNWNDARQAPWLASIIPDLIDAVQSTEGPTGSVPAGVTLCAVLCCVVAPGGCSAQGGSPLKVLMKVYCGLLLLAGQCMKNVILLQCLA